MKAAREFPTRISEKETQRHYFVTACGVLNCRETVGAGNISHQFNTTNGVLTAGSRSSWRKGRLARCSRRDSPAPAPYPVRFVAANSAFTVFRFAKRRKSLRLRSSSPKVLRLLGSLLNHWARSQATPRPTVKIKGGTPHPSSPPRTFQYSSEKEVKI